MSPETNVDAPRRVVSPCFAEPVRRGYYRIHWCVDLPKEEFDSPTDAAREACGLAGDCTGPANVYTVTDGDTGEQTDCDLTE